MFIYKKTIVCLFAMVKNKMAVDIHYIFILRLNVFINRYIYMLSYILVAFLA